MLEAKRIEKLELKGADGYRLTNVGRVNVLVGKNGCGKSTLLKAIDRLHQAENVPITTRYITPERSGVLEYNASQDHSMVQDFASMLSQRRMNQFHQFKQQTYSQFRKLELLFHRSVDQNVDGVREDLDHTFQKFVERINDLLDYVSLEQSRDGFEIKSKRTGDKVLPNRISSGESELVTLAIECLVFEYEAEEGYDNWLLIDEPDVHIHPDLQARFARFLGEICQRSKLNVLIATHSTALIGVLNQVSEAKIGFMKYGEEEIEMRLVDEHLEKILPVFGAHPLSSVFNEVPLLLVEGEDDEYIWHQAVRSSQGKIRLQPKAVGSVDRMTELEELTRKVMDSVYDNPIAYSLRDRDGTEGELEDNGSVVRCKLGCRNSENLILSDEVLEHLGSSWVDLEAKIENWLQNNSSHSHYKTMLEFKEGGYDRKAENVKALRNDFMGLLESTMPWTVAVGRTIAAIDKDDVRDGKSETGLGTFLGKKLVDCFFS